MRNRLLGHISKIRQTRQMAPLAETGPVTRGAIVIHLFRSPQRRARMAGITSHASAGR